MATLENLPISALLDSIAHAIALVLRLKDLAKQAGATDAELDALDARLTAAHEARQAEHGE